MRDPQLRQNCFHFSRTCELLQFTTEELVQRFGFLNDKRAVFANHLPLPPAPLQPRRQPFVFGWGGSHSHSDDLAFMAPAVVSFCARHPQAVFAYMGDQGNFERYFGPIKPSQKRFRPFGPMEDYEAFIESLHVGVAVVAPDGFSACRSDCKYLEYAQGGAAAVLSDHPIYQPHGEGGRALLFHDGQQLQEILEDLIQNPHKRQQLAEAAHGYAHQRVHRHFIEQRLQAYLPLLAQLPGEPLPLYPKDQRAPALILQLAPLMSAGENEAALALIADLLDAFPGHAYGVFCRIKSRFLLGKQHWPALLDEFGPKPLPLLYQDRAAELLFIAAQELGQQELAQKLLEDIADPGRRAWLSTPETAQNAAFYRNILQHNPFDFHALTRLATLLAERRHVGEEAEQLATMACLILPEAPELHALLGRIREARQRPKSRPRRD